MKINSYTILILVFFISPFVDSFTGYIVLSGISDEAFLGSPSQLLRLLIMFLSLFFIKEKARVITILIFAIYFIGIELFGFLILHNNVKGLFTGLVYSQKIIYAICVFFIFDSYAYTERRKDTLIKLYIYSALIYATLIIIPKILGIGYHTYDENTFGTKGFFASNNGLGLYLGTASLVCIYYLANIKSTIRLQIYYFLILISLVLIGSKTSILFSAISLLAFLYYKKMYVKTTIIVLGIIGIFLYFNQLITIFSTIFDVIIFRYNVNTFSQFILSMRDNYITNAIYHYSNEGALVLRNIFGTGLFMSFRNPGEINLIYDTLETDLFDLFFAYGIIGALVYIYIIMNSIVFSFVRKQIYLLLIWILVAGHSIMAGHVLFNGLSIISAIMVYVIIIKVDKFKNVVVGTTTNVY